MLGVVADAGQVMPLVRPACPGDIEALVQLRLENGHVHALLDPTVYRVPDSEKVREHFAVALAEDDPRSAMFVAVIDDAVLGLAEVALDPEPPAHQILEPLLSAHVHLVVAEQARGLGLGAALAEATENMGGRSRRTAARRRHPERQPARAAVLRVSRLPEQRGGTDQGPPGSVPLADRPAAQDHQSAELRAGAGPAVPIDPSDLLSRSGTLYGTLIRDDRT